MLYNVDNNLAPPDTITGGTPCAVLRLAYRCKYQYSQRSDSIMDNGFLTFAF